VATLGLCVGFPPNARGLPAASCVLLGGSPDQPVLQDSFDLKTSSAEIADQIQDLARALNSKLAGLDVQAIRVRVADTAPAANRKTGPKHRLMIEGALVLICRQNLQADRVKIRNGKELGEDLGTSKSDALALGKKLDRNRPDAAAAALAALVASS
jgi:hypothetical protein